MALSVLTIGHYPNSHGLYDSATKSIILKGTQEEMFDWKHAIEKLEQEADNAAAMSKVKEDRLNLLISAGNSPEDADTFLKKQMPYLYK